MEIIFFLKALNGIEFWKKSGNKTLRNKIEVFLKNIQSTPFEGIGKQVQLKHELSGR